MKEEIQNELIIITAELLLQKENGGVCVCVCLTEVASLYCLSILVNL